MTSLLCTSDLYIFTQGFDISKNQFNIILSITLLITRTDLVLETCSEIHLIRNRTNNTFCLLLRIYKRLV